MKGKELKGLVAEFDDDSDYICEIVKVERFSSFTRLIKVVSSSQFIITDDKSYIGEFDDYER